MKKFIMVMVITVFCHNCALFAVDPQPVTHQQFQAVNADGESDFGGLNPPETVVLEGIILNSPENLLDPTPTDPHGMGGEWQIYIQGTGSDHAGTAVWIGQNYGILGWIPPEGSYTSGEWIDELVRINHDPNSGYLFHPGDLVQVTGKYVFYNGKNNINEQHDKDPNSNFDIKLIEPALGLPQPDLVTLDPNDTLLDSLKDINDDFIFDSSRQTGCEHYQACLVRINDVSFVNPELWAPGATMEIVDSGGKTFPVLLGRGHGIQVGSNNLRPVFDVIGILDQECGLPHTAGYRIWVPDYDANGLVLTSRNQRRGNLPGDINYDGQVNLFDLAKMASQWLDCALGIGDCSVD
ncbi:MAG: hypothetical protein JXD22_03450 [Sedimentisphaerales bacterium]|nr:hypothetical protein [Sedimentisphaerales bacterium]